ncbi:DUF4124 domain-containing protein [Shewanella sp. NIFS-20-20]|uniref:DUF4124 domain-containing protein n=1 Tax=Shewanella sp. NIFS-20-20 TaxID=2853806 RepID=UPI001C45946D|nr:DUF4124 domain-containing protein [Shewanella sp. NIFS-20-20]MBV7317529.1 DUF4124 domain-containing protein [Shewanella sp. NIFS-20-20]
MQSQHWAQAICLTFLLILTAGVNASAKVYRWVDDLGRVHYSDEPSADAVEVELKPATINQISVTTPISAAEQNSPEVVYQLTLVSPENEATIRDNNGDFSVKLSLSQPEPAGAFYQLLLDGTLYNEGQSQALFQLTGVERGSHTLQAQLVSPRGKILAQTQAITIFMHQAIYHPPRPQPRAK